MPEDLDTIDGTASYQLLGSKMNKDDIGFKDYIYTLEFPCDADSHVWYIFDCEQAAKDYADTLYHQPYKWAKKMDGNFLWMGLNEEEDPVWYIYERRVMGYV
jgi:hypothetical protein